jgi:hypothetical protein
MSKYSGEEVAGLILITVIYVIPAFLIGFILLNAGGASAIGGLGLISFTIYAIIRVIKEQSE